MKIHPESDYAKQIREQIEKDKIKIVICVEGGVVYGVYSNQPYESLDVLLIDHDDLKTEGLSREAREAASDRETRCLMEHYIERPNVPESELIV